MRWCRTCVLPDTRPNLVIAEDGECNACKAHRTKPTIDWPARKAAFEKAVAHAKTRSAGYDCIIPVSGGKDSTWQTVVCLEHGLVPLAVTWAPPSRTEIGRQNLQNLIALGVDHIDYRISPTVERKFLLAAFERIGQTATPMHLAMFNIPLKLAVKFDIPLVVWGENSAFEYGSPDEASTGVELNSAWLRRFGVTGGTTAADWTGKELSEKELHAYYGPDDAELNGKGVRAVFLGYYFPWDPIETYRVAAAHGFRASTDGPRTGYYQFADIDDDFISIHHYLKWYKFGFSRLFDNLAIEIRNGRMTREKAISIIHAEGDPTPHADIEKFCAFVGITVARFFEIADKFRNPAIWQHRNGVWMMDNFLIPDWRWT